MGKVGQTQNNMRTEEVAQLVTHLLPRCEELLFISGTCAKLGVMAHIQNPCQGGPERRALAWIWVPVLALPLTALIL